MNIKQLAHDLGLAISTVSRALNGAADVSEATRARVVEAARARGYAPHQIGRSLRKGRHNTVGLMLPPKEGDENYTWSLFLTLASGIQHSVRQQELELVLFQTESVADEQQRLERIVERRLVDGIVLAGTRRRDPRLAYVADAGFPYVALGRSQSGGEHAWLDLDFESGAHQAVDRLCALGHRRIAIGTPDDDAMQGHLLRQGYRAALKQHHLPVDPKLVARAELSERGGYRLAEELLALPDPPTALVFQSDCMAIGAYRLLHERRLQPGRDVAVFGGVLTGELAQYLSPRLSGFTVDWRDLGVRLGLALLDRMAAADGAPRARALQQLWPLDIKPCESDALRLGEPG